MPSMNVPKDAYNRLRASLIRFGNEERDYRKAYDELRESASSVAFPVSPPSFAPLQPPKPWDELKTRIPVELEPGWIFRGHGRASWRLQTTLERDLPDAPADRRRVEDELLFAYQQSAHNYMGSVQLPTCRLDWLGAMQHHGAPTRLLDFTRSFYVAAYFAVEQCSDEEHCAVWAINERAIHDQALKLLQGNKRFATKKKDAALAHWIYRDVVQPSGRRALWEPTSFAAPAGLLRLSSRQLAQQAGFMLAGDLSQSFEDNLRATIPEHAELASYVRCYQIDFSTRGEVLADLRRMNITRGSLYPGLDGHTQSFRYLLAEPPAERRAALSAMRGDSSKWIEESRFKWETILKAAADELGRFHE